MYDVDAIEQQVLDAMAQETEEVAPEVDEGNDVDLQFDEDNVIDAEKDFSEEEVVEEIEDENYDENEEPEEYAEEEVSDEMPEESDEEETPQHKAFAEMRVQNRQLQEQMEQQAKLLEIVRKGSGFQTEEEMIQALIQAEPEIEKQSMGLDDDGYRKHKELQEKEMQLQQQQMQVYQEHLETRANRFQSELEKVTKDLGIKEDIVFNKLAESGHTDMEQILMGQDDYDKLFKSILIDEIVEKRAKERAEKELNRKSVESGRIDNTRNASATFEDNQEALLKKELEEYKKEQGY